MRACRIASCERQIISAPFSFGSQPQKRPHDSFAQMPPRIVPDHARRRSPKQSIP